MRIHDADGVQRPPSRRPNEAWVVRDAEKKYRADQWPLLRGK